MTSQINPNNIDGNYPVPGVPNNTQGFRSNFTETKTNFQYAAQEITALQNSGVFKAALPGTTLDNNMNDNLLYAVKLNDISYTYLPVAATAGSIAIDYSAAPFQQITTTGSISLSFTNWPATGSAGTVRVGLNITNTAHTVTLPAEVSQGLLGLQGYNSGTGAITFGQVGNYAFEFVTVDGGTTVWIFDNSRPTDIFTSPVTITSEAEANTTASGALVVAGGVGIAGNLYVGGNIVGNITVTGISLTGNVTGGNVISTGLVTAVGNVTGGNVRTGGLVSATGNITGGNLAGGQLSLSGNVISTLNVTGNINGGNIKSPGIMSAAGNVTGGNVITNGALVTPGSRINSDITTTGTVSATGNITGGNLIVAANVTANVVVSSAAGNIWFVGNLLPTANTFSLGSVVDPWESAWFGPESITIADSTGNVANAVVIENNAGNIVINTAGFNIKTLGTDVSIFRIESMTGQIFSNAVTSIENTTESANAASGSLITAGGAGIAKNLYVGGNITAGNVTTTLVTANLTGTATTATNLTAATGILAGSINIDPTAIGKNSTSTQTFTLTGLTTSHKVIVMPQADFTYGLSILAAYPSALNTLSVQFQEQGGGVDPAAFDLAYFAWV